MCSRSGFVGTAEETGKTAARSFSKRVHVSSQQEAPTPLTRILAWAGGPVVGRWWAGGGRRWAGGQRVGGSVGRWAGGPDGRSVFGFSDCPRGLKRRTGGQWPFEPLS